MDHIISINSAPYHSFTNISVLHINKHCLKSILDQLFDEIHLVAILYALINLPVVDNNITESSYVDGIMSDKITCNCWNEFVINHGHPCRRIYENNKSIIDEYYQKNTVFEKNYFDIHDTSIEIDHFICKEGLLRPNKFYVRNKKLVKFIMFLQDNYILLEIIPISIYDGSLHKQKYVIPCISSVSTIIMWYIPDDFQEHFQALYNS